MDPLDHLNDNSRNVQKLKLVWKNNLQILQKKKTIHNAKLPKTEELLSIAFILTSHIVSE